MNLEQQNHQRLTKFSIAFEFFGSHTKLDKERYLSTVLFATVVS